MYAEGVGAWLSHNGGGLACLFVIGAALAGLFSGMHADRRRRETLTETAEVTETRLESRLADLTDLMRSSRRVLEEVQAEIQARIVLAEEAKRSADEALQVAQLNEAQRLAVARLVRAELNSEVLRSSRRALWQGFAINLVFFVAGVAATMLLAK